MGLRLHDLRTALLWHNKPLVFVASVQRLLFRRRKLELQIRAVVVESDSWNSKRLGLAVSLSFLLQVFPLTVCERWMRKGPSPHPKSYVAWRYRPAYLLLRQAWLLWALYAGWDWRIVQVLDDWCWTSAASWQMGVED